MELSRITFKLNADLVKGRRKLGCRYSGYLEYEAVMILAQALYRELALTITETLTSGEFRTLDN